MTVSSTKSLVAECKDSGCWYRREGFVVCGESGGSCILAGAVGEKFEAPPPPAPFVGLTGVFFPGLEAQHESQ